MDNFIDNVEILLHTKSTNELKALLLKIAADIPDSKRQQFITLLENKRVTISKRGDNGFDVGKVQSRIKELYENIEDYEIEAYYYESYERYDDRGEGYDIKSDDGFSEEFYICYTGAVGILEHCFYKEAEEAFTVLFQIIEKFDEYHEGDDEGPFYFDTLIDENMIEIDLKKMAALKCYSGLMAKPEDPEGVLNDIFDTLEEYSGKLTLKDILHAGSEPIQDLTDVLEVWISVLYEQPVTIAAGYMKEAVLLLDKVEIMEDYVNTVGLNEPKAYINLCDLYFGQGKAGNAKIIATALNGLKCTGINRENRDVLAGILAAAAKDTDDKIAYKYAVTERFYSKSSLENYMAVLELGDANTAEVVIKYLDKSFWQSDKIKAQWEDKDYYLIHFINKDYDLVYNAFKSDKASLGWSSSLKGLMIPFFIGLLSGFNEKASVTRGIIEEKITCRIENGAFYKLLRENMGAVTKEQDKNWYDRCVEEVEDRIDAIVSAQHRGSYGKAARLLAAIYEMRLYRNEEAPSQIVYTYTAKYPRHTAFKAELRSALAEARLRGVNF